MREDLVGLVPRHSGTEMSQNYPAHLFGKFEDATIANGADMYPITPTFRPANTFSNTYPYCAFTA